MDYPVIWRNQEVGKAAVNCRGLYYEVQCLCRIPETGMHRVIVSGAGKRADLGILLPEKGEYVLKTSFPVNRIGKGELRFELLKNGEQSGEFIPITENEPFPCIEKLKHARLEIRNGVIGALIEKTKA